MGHFPIRTAARKSVKFLKIFVRACQWKRLRTVASLAFVAIALAGCENNRVHFSAADWSKNTSKGSTINLFAHSDCGTPWRAPHITSGLFYEATYSAPVTGKPGVQRLYYFDVHHKKVAVEYTVAELNTVAQQIFSAAQPNADCIVLYQIPQSDKAVLPFASKDQLGLYDYRAQDFYFLKSVVFLFFAMMLFPIMLGMAFDIRFSLLPHNRITSCHAYGIITFIIAAVGLAYGAISPWWAFSAAEQYVDFYNHLPRVDSIYLRPIVLSELSRIAAGPPHPTEMETNWWLLCWILPAVFWIAFYTQADREGVYWQFTPLPIAVLHDQCEREGRSPTADEIVAATREAMQGKELWQLRIMEEKTREFKRRF